MDQFEPIAVVRDLIGAKNYQLDARRAIQLS